MAVCPGPAMIGTVLSVLVLYGVALLERNRALIFRVPSVRTWCWCLRCGVSGGVGGLISLFVPTQTSFSPASLFPARNRMVPNHPLSLGHTALSCVAATFTSGRDRVAGSSAPTLASSWLTCAEDVLRGEAVPRFQAQPLRADPACVQQHADAFKRHDHA